MAGYNGFYQPFGGFPQYGGGYQAYQQPMQQPQQAQQPQSLPSNLIWVNGEREAAMYPVAPNNAVALWDNSGAAVYIKKADPSGKQSMAVYDLIERKEQPQQANEPQGVEFATKTDLSAALAAIDELKRQLEEMRLKNENKAFSEGVKKDVSE